MHLLLHLVLHVLQYFLSPLLLGQQLQLQQQQQQQVLPCWRFWNRRRRKEVPVYIHFQHKPWEGDPSNCPMMYTTETHANPKP